MDSTRFLSAMLEALAKLVTPLLFWLKGRKDERDDIARNDTEVLKRQRDNDTRTISATRSRWMRVRKRNKQ